MECPPCFFFPSSLLSILVPWKNGWCDPSVSSTRSWNGLIDDNNRPWKVGGANIGRRKHLGKGTNSSPYKGTVFKKYIWSNHGFSGKMLVFREVHPENLTCLKSKVMEVWCFRWFSFTSFHQTSMTYIATLEPKNITASPKYRWNHSRFPCVKRCEYTGNSVDRYVYL